MSRKPSMAGFTLIEMIGVLSIIAIMAAVIMPNFIKQIDAAHADAETKTLKNLAHSMEQYILTRKAIPSSANWIQAISAYSEVPALKVSNNERGFKRQLYVDPRFLTAIDTFFSSYTQGIGLALPPTSPRIMMVSGLRVDVPQAPTTSASFNAIWDQQAGALVVESDDVKIQRMHLGYLFHRILLTNKNTVSPSYQLEAGAKSPIPQAIGGVDGSLDLYIINGSKLSLFLDPASGSTLNHSMLVMRDESLMYGTDAVNWFWGHP